MLSHKIQEMTGGRRQLDGGTPCNLYAFLNMMRSHYGPGVDSSSNRNEYQDYFLGVKAAGA